MEPRFDLKTALATWRAFHVRRRVFSPEDLDELEVHLRAHIQALQSEGHSLEAAFREAVRELGDLVEAEGEYEKVYWGKLKQRHQLKDELIWKTAMLKNYLKIAYRKVLREKGYTFINVTGLSIGMVCCLLITLYVRHELSYDRYHEKADRIYRLTTEAGASGTTTHFAAVAPIMATVMRAEFPEVEESARVIHGSEIVQVDDTQFREDRFYYADSTVFDVFSYTFVAGDAQTALDRPHTVVLTRTTARKYFGDAHPLGQTLRVGDGVEFTVTGVIEEVPSASHFRFDCLASMSSLPWSRNDSWLGNFNFGTYLVLRPDAAPEALEAKFPALIERNVGPALRELGAVFRFELQPLTEIHLHSRLEGELEPNSDVSYVYILSAVALIILLIACINFMNLATARSADRAKEVGMRKVLGAYRGQLIRQFLAEALLLVVLAFALALVLVLLVLPVFSQIVGRDLVLDLSWRNPILAGFMALIVAVGLLAGSYPALFLSGFMPVRVLKGRFKTGMAGVALRKGLVVTQFVISTTLIIGTLVVQQQLDYARSRQLGFDKEQVVVLPLHREDGVVEQMNAFKREAQQHPGVLNVTAASHFPGGPVNDRVFFPEGRGLDESIHMWEYRVDFDYIETLEMKLVDGRGFSVTQPADSFAVIINETAMRRLGWASVEGKRFVEYESSDFEGDRTMLPVIGVVEDFHFESFHHAIRPLVIRIEPWRPGNLLVRVRSGRLQEVLGALEETWTATSGTAPFEYTFLDEQFDQLYRTDARLGRIFSYFAGLAVFIACLGLFGLTAFSVEQRIKEVGVRKVLGASVMSIVGLLSTDFLKLIGIAFVVAIPLAYFTMQRWLDAFAYRIELGLGVFLLAGVLVVFIALGTVSYQSIKAALADPVKSLRYE